MSLLLRLGHVLYWTCAAFPLLPYPQPGHSGEENSFLDSVTVPLSGDLQQQATRGALNGNMRVGTVLLFDNWCDLTSGVEGGLCKEAL